MIESIKKFFNDIFTEPNNQTVCVTRVMGILAFLYGMGAHAYGLFWQHLTFDLSQFAIGYSGMIGALGVALGIKKDSA